MKRSFILTTLAVLISFIFATNAYPAETDAAKAKKHFIQGVALYNESNFEAALIEFAASYKYKNNWKVKYYIGIAYQALHRFVEAEKELKAYIEEGGNDIPKNKKAKAEEVLSQLAGVIGSVMLEANVEGALIYMDGKSVGKTPLAGPLSLDVGHYEVEVKKKGYETYTTEIDLPGGEELTIKAELKKKGAETAVKKEEDEEQPLPDAIKETKGKKKTVKPAAFYGMAGATGALLIGTVVCSVLAMQKHNEFDDTDADSPENIEKREDLKSEGETLNVVSDALVGVTAAAAAATIILVFFTDFKKKEKKTSSKPKVQFGGTSISLIHHF